MKLKIILTGVLLLAAQGIYIQGMYIVNSTDIAFELFDTDNPTSRFTLGAQKEMEHPITGEKIKGQLVQQSIVIPLPKGNLRMVPVGRWFATQTIAKSTWQNCAEPALVEVIISPQPPSGIGRLTGKPSFAVKINCPRAS